MINAISKNILKICRGVLLNVISTYQDDINVIDGLVEETSADTVYAEHSKSLICEGLHLLQDKRQEDIHALNICIKETLAEK